jgi:MerR family redox-sensitive transcriptional activator SoxR
MQNRQITNRGLSIGQISERTGLAPSAIRFYEDEGLVTPFRNAGGQRRYDRADIRRLSFVMIAQTMGFSISQIRETLQGLPDHRTPTKADWSRISRGFRKSLDARIAQMEAMRDKLDGCIGCGCLSLKACTLYNPKDRINRRGSGPRYLMGDTVADAEESAK